MAYPAATLAACGDVLPPQPPWWRDFQRELRRAVPESAYDIWLAPVTFVGLEGGLFVLDAPEVIKSVVRDRFSRVMLSCAQAVFSDCVMVDFASANGQPSSATMAMKADTSEDQIESGLRFVELDATSSFESFAVGPGNLEVYTAALAVADAPGNADHNPLFMYGPPGYGKTHLLHAIWNRLLETQSMSGRGLSFRKNGRRIGLITAEAFVDEYVIASQLKSIESMSALKARVRNHDVLLVDGAEIFRTKPKSMEAFRFLLDELTGCCSQVVLVSEFAPTDLSGLDDRLKERFMMGLVAEVKSLTYETRLQILLKQVEANEYELADDAPAALELIAQRVDKSPRVLLGALRRVVFCASIRHEGISVAVVEGALGSLHPSRTLKVVALTVSDVINAACEVSGIGQEVLFSKNRTQAIARVRQMAMYVARQKTTATLPEIGRAFGGRNHTTVMYACNQARVVLEGDGEGQLFGDTESLYRAICAKLEGK